MRLQIRTCADLRTRYASSVLKRCFKTEIVLNFNSLIDPDCSPLENIFRLILRPDSILQLEIEHTIATETSSPEV